MRRWFGAVTFGLRRRLMLIFGTLIFAFVALTFYVNLHIQSDMIMRRLQARIDGTFQIATVAAQPETDAIAMAEFSLLLSRLEGQTGIAFGFLSGPDGRVLAAGPVGRGLATLVPRTSPGGTIGKIDMLPVTRPIASGDLTLGIDLRDVQRDLAAVRAGNLGLGAVFLFLGLLLSSMAADRVTRPLARLTRMTRAASDGNLAPTPVIRTNDEVETLALSFNRMLGALRSSLEEINHMAYRDKLTGLMNRAWFGSYMKQVLGRAECDSFALFFLDIDRFKTVNDTLGHDIGDRLLIGFARRLEEAVEACGRYPVDLPSAAALQATMPLRDVAVARLGGDEFTLVLRGPQARADAAALAETITSMMAEPFMIDSRSLAITTSIGIALAPSDGATTTELLRAADTAMYTAKGAGRNTYRFFSAAGAARQAGDATLGEELRAALDADALDVYLQPQFDIATGRVCGAEALVRWQHAEAGLLTPEAFLPRAAASNLMPQMGRRVVQKAIAQFARWPTDPAQPVKLALNVSRDELADPGFLAVLRAALQSHRILPGMVELEIAAADLMAGDPALGDHLRGLSAAGLRIAVDGVDAVPPDLAGWAAIGARAFKIDRALIGRLVFDPAADAQLATLVALARAQGMTAIAEGVENTAQLAQLRREGCHVAQGYALARPMQDADFVAFLIRSNHLGRQRRAG